MRRSACRISFFQKNKKIWSTMWSHRFVGLIFAYNLSWVLVWILSKFCFSFFEREGTGFFDVSIFFACCCSNCEETLGGKNYTTMILFLFFYGFFSSKVLASYFLFFQLAFLDFLHFTGHHNRVAFSNFFSTKLLVIECAIVLITISVYWAE